MGPSPPNTPRQIWIVRSGNTLLELLVVVAILAMLLTLMLPGIQAVRETARNAQCKNNMRQLGTALANYVSAHASYPSGAKAGRDRKGGIQVYENANVRLFPYLELDSLTRQYDFESPWEVQSRKVTSYPVRDFVCPSNDTTNPGVRPTLARFGYNQVYGVTTYLYCKGATDAWCVKIRAGKLVAGEIPPRERGMFDLNSKVRPREIKDGLSNTIAMGEGAGGPSWPVCRGTHCRKPFELNAEGKHVDALVGWIAGEPNSDVFYNRGFIATSIYGCTVEALNKYPVTDTLVSSLYWDDCRCSRDGGPHSTSNFRSHHPGGGNFLFAGGQVRFISDDIGMKPYRALSTIRGEEIVRFPWK